MWILLKCITMIFNTVLVLTVTLCVANAGITINIFGDKSSVIRDFGTCDIVSCDALCKRLGFTYGVCVQGQCKCERKDKESVEVAHPALDEDGCNNLGCEQLCRRLGFAGGVCVGSRCKCDIIQPQAEIEPPTTDKNDAVPDLLMYWEDDQVADDNAVDKEDNAIQPQIINLKEEPAVDSHSRSARAICYALQCNTACIRAFYRGGVCVYNTCRCYR